MATVTRELWIEGTADRLGFAALADGLVGSRAAGPYLFVIVVLLIDVPGLSLVGYLQTGRILFLENPGSWIVPPGVLLVTWATLRLRDRYARAIDRLPDGPDADVGRVTTQPAERTDRLLAWLGVPRDAPTREDADLETVFPTRLAVLILGGGLLFHASWLVLDPGAGSFVTEVAGPTVAAVKFYGIYPFVYYPLGAQFVALVVGIHVLLPFKIRRGGLVDFTDPSGFAGLEPYGRLLKTSSVSYFALLTLFAGFLTVARGTGPTRAFPLSFIVAGMGFGVALFYAPVYWLHVHMHGAKQAKIDAIATRVRESGHDDRMFPDTEPSSTAEMDEYTFRDIQLRRVENAKEFPVDLSIVQEVMFALVLPPFASYLLDSTVMPLLP